MNFSDKMKENFYSSVQYFSNFFPIKTTNSLYEIGEHTVGLLITSSAAFYGKTSPIGPLTVLAVSWFAPKTYCDFQKEYKEDANFVGFMEIAMGAIHHITSVISGSHNSLDFKFDTLYPVFLGVVTTCLHGVVLPAIADDIAHCS
jgi:hypothetical protein